MADTLCVQLLRRTGTVQRTQFLDVRLQDGILRILSPTPKKHALVIRKKHWPPRPSSIDKQAAQTHCSDRNRPLILSQYFETNSSKSKQHILLIVPVCMSFSSVITILLPSSSPSEAKNWSAKGTWKTSTLSRRVTNPFRTHHVWCLFARLLKG